MAASKHHLLSALDHLAKCATALADCARELGIGDVTARQATGIPLDPDEALAFLLDLPRPHPGMSREQLASLRQEALVKIKAKAQEIGLLNYMATFESDTYFETYHMATKLHHIATELALRLEQMEQGSR